MSKSSFFSQSAIRNPQYAFTLLELMLVSIIVLVMTAVSTPLFKRTYEDLKLTSASKEAAALMHFCREKAVFERRDYRFLLDPDAHRYQALVKEEETGEYAPLPSRWGRVFSLPHEITIEADTQEIDFSPDGNAGPASIYLIGKDGAARTILVEENTGRIITYDYKKE